MILMDGTQLSKQIRLQLAEEVAEFDVAPKLVVIQVGDNTASTKYIRMKQKASEETGIIFELHHLKSDVSATDVEHLIQDLNQDDSVAGIIVQLPLPATLVADEIIEYINPRKDVDGLTDLNQERLNKDQPGLFPATAEGVMALLKHYKVVLNGANAVVLGRSKLVGSPVAKMLESEGAAVIVCHSKTNDVASYTINADVIVSAVGKPNLVTVDMVKPGAVVIDVGMDVDFENVSKVAGMITPPIGGVGPMTVAMLLSNVVKAAKGING